MPHPASQAVPILDAAALGLEVTGRSARRFLQRRGLDLELANRHRATQMGNAGKLWENLSHRFELDRLRSAGLVSRSDNFLLARHRLLFFYFDDEWPAFVQARDVTGTS